MFRWLIVPVVFVFSCHASHFPAQLNEITGHRLEIALVRGRSLEVFRLQVWNMHSPGRLYYVHFDWVRKTTVASSISVRLPGATAPRLLSSFASLKLERDPDSYHHGRDPGEIPDRDSCGAILLDSVGLVSCGLSDRANGNFSDCSNRFAWFLARLREELRRPDVANVEFDETKNWISELLREIESRPEDSAESYSRTQLIASLERLLECLSGEPDGTCAGLPEL